MSIDLTKKIHVGLDEEYGSYYIDLLDHSSKRQEIREAYRRLFEAAPKMLRLIKLTARLLRKDYFDESLNDFGDPHLGYCATDMEALIAEIEGTEG